MGLIGNTFKGMNPYIDKKGYFRSIPHGIRNKAFRTDEEIIDRINQKRIIASAGYKKCFSELFSALRTYQAQRRIIDTQMKLFVAENTRLKGLNLAEFDKGFALGYEKGKKELKGGD